MSERPTTAVIVPFAGSDDELRACLAALNRLVLTPGDELLVADNRGPGAPPAGTGTPPAGPAAGVVPAGGVRAAGFARNRAAALTDADWLVFLDADTRPSPDLLDRYFDPPPQARTALLAGGIVDRPGGSSAAARRSAARGQMSQRTTLDRAGRPYAQSANLAVRRSAFAAAGGFDERARSGEDADLCWRLQDAGWGLEERPCAVAEHLTRPGLGALLGQLARHGSGAAWLERRYPGQFPAPRPRTLGARVLHAVRAAALAGARGRREEAADAVLALLEGCAFDAGRLLLSNRPRRS